MNTSITHMLAQALVWVPLVLACTPLSKQPTAQADHLVHATGSPYAITADAIPDCPPDRLEIIRLDVPMPAFGKHERQPLKHAIFNHGHLQDDRFIQFLPRLNHQLRITAITALRYHVPDQRWLEPVEYELSSQHSPLPHANDLIIHQREHDHILRWHTRSHTHGVRFSASTGTFAPTTDADALPSLTPRGGLFAHPAHPPNPEPTTGVTLEVDAHNPRHITLLASSGELLGTIDFPSNPGTYIGLWTSTRTALLWSNAPVDTQMPLEHRYHTYLVQVDTGATCRIPHAIETTTSAVFRPGPYLLIVGALMTEEEPYNCPEGAPCMAPEQPYFYGASGVLLYDRGP